MAKSMAIDFAVFILTHGRPDNVITLKTLKQQGYTGAVYLIVDNEDNAREEYVQRFGKDNVIVFDKKAEADQVDEGNNFDERRTITHARNASFRIAKELGVRRFIQLDDDYQFFEWRMEPGMHKVQKLDKVFAAMVELYDAAPIVSLAFAQGGDFIGGTNSKSFTEAKLKRKCMNSFICSNERPFRFIGAMNEDVNTYTTLASRGALFFTMPLVSLTQKATQSQAGGISDMYLRFGTYCKAFTTVMMMPSCVQVAMMGDKHKRLHHQIRWRNCVPVILHERFCKRLKQPTNSHEKA